MSELRKMRLKLGLWLKDVAVGTGYTISHISYVERGRDRAGRKMVARLAEFYGIPEKRMARICAGIPRT